MELRNIGTATQSAIQTQAGNTAAMGGMPNTVSDQAPVQMAKAVPQAASVPDMDQLKQAAHSVANSLKSAAKGLEFEIEQDSSKVIVKIMDPETGDVIKQIPSEEVLRIAKSLDAATGKLLKATA